jgi:hypothetical protein
MPATIIRRHYNSWPIINHCSCWFWSFCNRRTLTSYRSTCLNITRLWANRFCSRAIRIRNRSTIISQTWNGSILVPSSTWKTTDSPIPSIPRIGNGSRSRWWARSWARSWSCSVNCYCTYFVPIFLISKKYRYCYPVYFGYLSYQYYH